MYTAQTWALRCELKQYRYPEESNAGNMTEFLVNRPAVVLVENHTQTHWLAHLACAIVDSFRVKVGVILERKKEENKKR